MWYAVPIAVFSLVFLCSGLSNQEGVTEQSMMVDMRNDLRQDELVESVTKLWDTTELEDSLNATTITARYGSGIILQCPQTVARDSLSSLLWLTNQKELMPMIVNNSQHDGVDSDLELHNGIDHIRVLNNGSLLISFVGRMDPGRYTCMVVSSQGNVSSAFIILILDSDIVLRVSEYSLLVGFLSAAGFFLAAVILGAVRYFIYLCSREERVKRKSIRELVSIMRSSSHMDRLSAYKTAKLDRFSSFRSATMDQLVAFKTAKIEKLRTYKHATVLGIQQYTDRMRDHYSSQTARVKRNCAARMDKLRRNYAAQRGRLKDHRSAQMKRVRDNYNAQRAKIREYSANQKARLREQYKVQQQHVIKLLELLDVGNCVNVIRDDCERTESAIFDYDDDVQTTEGSDAGRLEGVPDDIDNLSPDGDDCAFLDDDVKFDDDDDVIDDFIDDGPDINLDGADMTIDDVLGEIVACVESINNSSSLFGADGGGGLQPEECRAVEGGSQVGSGKGGGISGGSSGESSMVSVTLSLRDIHRAGITDVKSPLEEEEDEAQGGGATGGVQVETVL